MFIDLWHAIARENPKYADDIMTTLFHAISQTALKIAFLHKKSPTENDDLVEFFESAWHYGTQGDNYHTNFLKKL